MGDIKNRLHIELSNFLEKSRASAEVVTTDEWDFESTTSANSITPACRVTAVIIQHCFQKIKC